jgi:nucleotide-binding universal stress UspA family protein
MKTILAPIDFSTASQHVVRAAIRLASALEARLVLLHVLQPLSRLGGDAALAESGAEFAALVETDASRRLAQLQRELMNEGVVAHAIHRRGNAGRCIVQQANRLAADYIVIGSHGHSAVYDLIVGSTTTRVLKDVSCRVMIVPPRITNSGPKERPSR